MKFVKNGAIHDCGMCLRNLNLLGHAQLIELDIGSSCGGHGVCGGDKIQIVEPSMRALLSAVTEEEREHLSAAELADGWRLGCQCYPQKDGCVITAQVADNA